MSKLQNTRYLESAQELFESSVADGDTKTAKAVIADLRDNGFTDEAVYLEKKLAPKPVINILTEAAERTIRPSSYHDDVYLPGVAEDYGGAV